MGARAPYTLALPVRAWCRMALLSCRGSGGRTLLPLACTCRRASAGAAPCRPPGAAARGARVSGAPRPPRPVRAGRVPRAPSPCAPACSGPRSTWCSPCRRGRGRLARPGHARPAGRPGAAPRHALPVRARAARLPVKVGGDLEAQPAANVLLRRADLHELPRGHHGQLVQPGVAALVRRLGLPPPAPGPVSARPRLGRQSAESTQQGVRLRQGQRELGPHDKGPPPAPAHPEEAVEAQARCPGTARQGRPELT